MLKEQPLALSLSDNYVFLKKIYVYIDCFFPPFNMYFSYIFIDNKHAAQAAAADPSPCISTNGPNPPLSVKWP